MQIYGQSLEKYIYGVAIMSLWLIIQFSSRNIVIS